MLDQIEREADARLPVTGRHDAPEISKPITAMDWFRAIGPRVSKVVKPFQGGALWTAYADDAQLRRLARLQARIERKQTTLSELKQERRSIMQCCVKRMRRDRGLDK